MHHRRWAFSLFFFLATALLYGCSSIPNHSSNKDLAGLFPLLAPSTLNQTLHAFQNVELSHNGVRYFYQTVVSVDAKEIHVVIMDTLGQRLIAVQFDGINLTTSQSDKHTQMIAKQHLVRDLQWLFWPIETLSEFNKQSGWTFAETTDSRSIYFNDNLIANIKKTAENTWNNSYSYDNRPYSYHLTVESTTIFN